MLIDVKLYEYSEEFLKSKGVEGYVPPRRIREGVYQIDHNNFYLCFDYKNGWDLEPKFPELLNEENFFYMPPYGVCDGGEQFFEHDLGKFISNSERKFVVSFNYIPKVLGEINGWRWEKHGPYIGTGNPKAEYLTDEPEFDDGVFLYDILEYVIK